MKLLHCFGAVLVVSVMTGCGGGGGSSSAGGGNPNTTATVTQQVQSGVSALNTAATTPGSSASAAITSALQSFTSAKNAINGSTPAGLAAQVNVGYALTQAAATAYQIEATLPGVNALPAKSRTASSTSTQQKAISRLAFFSGSLFSATKPTTVGDVIPIKWAMSLRATAQNRGSSLTYTQVTQALEEIYLPPNTTSPNGTPGLLNQVIAALTPATITALESDPLTVEYLDNNGNVQTVKIGAAEAYALKSAAEFVANLIDFLLAWDFDPGSFDFTAPAFTGSFGGSASPSTFLPPSPFGTLYTYGPAYLSDELSLIKASTNDLSSAVTVYSNRQTAGSTGWLGNLWEESASDIPTTQAAIAEAVSLENGGTTNLYLDSSGGQVMVLVDPTAWFTNPPGDLKAYFASLTSDGTTVTENLGSISDPTFDGLFVSPGLPSSVLYSNVYPASGLTNAEAAAVAGIFNAFSP